MMVRIHIAAALLACAALTPVAYAQNNLARQGWYADPEVRIFAGQYWIYPTSSDPAMQTADEHTYTPQQQELRAGHVIHVSYLRQTSLDAFSSPDLVHWTKHPDVLDVKNVAGRRTPCGLRVRSI